MFRKIILSLFLIVAFTLGPGIVYAETTATLGGQVDGDYPVKVDDDGTLIINSDGEISLGGVELTNWGEVKVFTPMDFVCGDFISTSPGTGVTVLSSTTTPSLETRNRITCLVWNDDEECYAQVTFRVPANYVSGGGFKAFVDFDSGTNQPAISYHILNNSDGTAWDSEQESPEMVELTGTAGTPELVDLPATGVTISAGDIITFGITRSDGDDSTADLELYYVDFYYNQ